MKLKRANGKFVIGSGKDYIWHLTDANCLDRTKTVDLSHLNIQKTDVDLNRLYGADRFLTVFTFACDFNIFSLAQKSSDHRAKSNGEEMSCTISNRIEVFLNPVRFLLLGWNAWHHCVSIPKMSNLYQTVWKEYQR